MSAFPAVNIYIYFSLILNYYRFDTSLQRWILVPNVLIDCYTVVFISWRNLQATDTDVLFARLFVAGELIGCQMLCLLQVLLYIWNKAKCVSGTYDTCFICKVILVESFRTDSGFLLESVWPYSVHLIYLN